MSDILRYARSLVESDPNMKFYAEGRTWVNFTLTDWDAGLKYREPVTNAAILPYLSFGSPLKLFNLTVGLWAGSANQANREEVLRVAKERRLAGVVDKLSNCDPTRQYCEISQCNLLNRSSTARPSEEVEPIISLKWNDFLKRELPCIVEAVRQERWLWESP